MKKKYIAPSLTAYSYVEPLTPLCESRTFGAGSSDETSGGTTSNIWSNKQDSPNQGGMWKYMDN